MEPTEAIGAVPTKALSDVIASEEQISPDDSVVQTEPPLRLREGTVSFKILTSSQTSEKIVAGIQRGDIKAKGGGHDEIVWDRRYKDQIEEARTKFYEFVEQGYKPFLRKQDGTLYSRQMTAFDPNAEEIIMVSPTRPG